MSVLMTDEPDHVLTATEPAAHVKRVEGGANLCGEAFGMGFVFEARESERMAA